MMDRKSKIGNKGQEVLSRADLIQAVEALQAGGMVLLPTDTVWSVAVSLAFPDSITRLKATLPGVSVHDMEVLCASVESLKDFVEQLHPRLETLLMHHIRPLSILFESTVGLPDSVVGRQGVAIRVSLDRFVQELMELVETPLVVFPVCDAEKAVPTHFGGISSAVLQRVDYVVKYRQNERHAGELPVLVRLIDEEELDFIRE